MRLSWDQRLAAVVVLAVMVVAAVVLAGGPVLVLLHDLHAIEGAA